MGIAVAGIIGLGILLELAEGRLTLPLRWIKMAVAANLLLFVATFVGLLFFAAQEVMAQATAEAAARGEVTTGMGLALIGVGIPTGFAAIGAGIALGPVGAAALAVVAEKPEIFGRTLVYVGLAEGIAIYGLVVSILILGRL
jgi:V/A-type H+-transporting ATPase subunit K